MRPGTDRAALKIGTHMFPTWSLLLLGGLVALLVALALFGFGRETFRRHPIYIAPDAPEAPAETRHPRYVKRATPPPAMSSRAVPSLPLAPPSEADGEQQSGNMLD
jgi:hypothetical protein